MRIKGVLCLAHGALLLVSHCSVQGHFLYIYTRTAGQILLLAAMKGFMTVRFDHVNPASEKSNQNDVRSSLAGLDYSPLPRLTMRSLAMGCLVSMGGLM